MLFSSVQSLSRVRLFATPWTTACQASLSITTSRSLLKLMPTESVIPFNHLIPLSSPSPPAFNLPQYQGLFKWVSSSHQVTKVLEFQLQHQSFQWIFRTSALNYKEPKFPVTRLYAVLSHIKRQIICPRKINKKYGVFIILKLWF